MISVRPLVGLKSLWALNSFHKLMLGIKMIPAYMTMSYEDFFDNVSRMSEIDQEKVIREAVLFVDLQKEEIEALACFCEDKNGVAFGPENLKSKGPSEIVDILVAVCKEIAKINVKLVTDVEKKK